MMIHTYRWCYFCFLMVRLELSLSACGLASTDYKGWTPHNIIRWLPTVTGCFGPSKQWHPTVGGSTVSMTFLIACHGTSSPFLPKMKLSLPPLLVTWLLSSECCHVIRLFSAMSKQNWLDILGTPSQQGITRPSSLEPDMLPSAPCTSTSSFHEPHLTILPMALWAQWWWFCIPQTHAWTLRCLDHIREY